MSTYTENYSLIKPDEEDCYDVQDFNGNMDAIDQLMAATADEIEIVSEKIGSPDDTGATTVFGKLNASASPIKSMQTHDISMSANAEDNIAIVSVVPDKCLIFMERLSDSTGLKTKVVYTLSNDKINIVTSCGVSGTVNLRFKIIEFN